MTAFFSILSNLDASTGTLIASLGTYGSGAIFLGVLFLGESAIFISLLLSQQGVLSLGDVFIYSTLGTITADIFWFIIGRYFPQRLIPGLFHRAVISPINSFLESVTKERLFLSIIFLKFFIGARLVIILYLGRQKISFAKFLLYDVMGTIVYMVLLTGIGVIFGRFIHSALPSFHIFSSIVTGLLIIFCISHVARSVYARSRKKEL